MDGQAFGSRAFRGFGQFSYLEDQDRHLSSPHAATIRLGIIGCGMMGVEHMRNALLEGRAQIAGLFDPAPRSIEQALSTLQRQGTAPTVYRTLEDACADPASDALIIATPNHTHLDVLRCALASNKAIFLEKPIASTLEDAIEVCRLAAKHSNLLRIGMQYRYKAVYAEALHEVAGRKSLGRVHSLNLLEHRFPFLDKVGQWNKFNASSGGTLVEKCCHYFDLLNLFAAEAPEQVFACGNQAVNFRTFEYAGQRADALDQAQVAINYANGVIGAFSLSMFVPGSAEQLIVCGEQGRLVASETARLGEPNRNHLEIWAGEHGASRSCTPSYPPYIEKAGHHGSTFFEHVAFMDDLATGRNTGPSPGEAARAIAVGVAAQQSIAQRAAIDLVDVVPQGVDLQALDQA